MVESHMEAMAVQEEQDTGDTPSPEIEFTARAVPYSSVVGSSVTLHDPTGRVIGQLALLNFGGLRPESEYWANRLTRALNNGARAEKAIANMIKRGMIKTSAEMPEGKGGPPRTAKPAIDVREFVRSLHRGEGDGTAIHGDARTKNS